MNDPRHGSVAVCWVLVIGALFWSLVAPATADATPVDPPVASAVDVQSPEAQSSQPPQGEAPRAQPPQPAPPQPSRRVERVFAGDVGFMFNPIKPDKAADFEMVMARLREALQRSDDPIRKQQAVGWKVFRSVEPGPDRSVVYVFVMSPAIKGADYAVSKILAEAFPVEVQELYEKFVGAFAGGQTLVNLTLVQDFAR